MATPLYSSSVLQKGTSFGTSCLLLWEMMPFQKGSNLEGQNLLPSKFFPVRDDHHLHAKQEQKLRSYFP